MTTNEPVKIKKYANRRLYNTETSTYVTLHDLAEMVQSERDFVVVDAKTDEDLTHGVLTQIILEQESKGENLLPVNFLRQLIRFYGDSMQGFVPGYLEMSLDSLAQQQDRYREQFPNPLGGSAFDAMQKQTKQNMKIFEQALSVFAPTKPGSSENEQPSADNQAPEPETGDSSKKDEISLLQMQLSEMQSRLEKISQSSE